MLKVFIENTKDDQGEENGKLFLESDGAQFIVVAYKVTKPKNELESAGEAKTNLGYFPSVASALRFIVKKKVMESNAQTLYELLEDLKRLEEWIHTKVAV